MTVDLPPKLQERVVCSIMAAMKYEVPANILLAVAEKEGGTPGQWVKNSNGTFDIGSMQFNTFYLKDLKKYGITTEDVAEPGCYSFDLAAWRIRGHLIHDKHDLWTRAANYHSRTPKYNQIYRQDLIKKATKWAHWLEVRFPTYGVTTAGIAPLRAINTRTPGVAPQEKIYRGVKKFSNQQAINALNAFYAKNPMRGFS